MRRKIICLFTAAVMCLSGAFTGCSSYEKADDGRLSIVTTCFPPYDFARAVTGGDADITMLLCPGAEAHSYEPTPRDIADIQQCDVFIYIGGEGEVWVDEILESFDTEGITIIRLFDFVDPLCEEEVPGASPNGHTHEHDDDEGGEDSDEGEYDEHIWTSPKNAEKCVERIRNALCEAYEEDSAAYDENAAAYMELLAELDSDFTDMAENAPNNLIVIGDKFPFRYLTYDYNLDYLAAFSGCSSESEPGVYTMAFLIEEILEHDIDTVFYLEFSTKKLAEKLCDATGAEMLPLQSCHNVSKEDFENGVTYIDLMRRNLENLKEALY
ncbi:MAG: metal ABC transporter substrate-binding protein [Ruminococcus sp.]|nr:metal ABC transporter substrate-binding protein [Ruminococcus sp.]